MAADTCCIRVACRIRPLNSKEKASGSQFVVNFPRETSVSLGVCVCVIVIEFFSLLSKFLCFVEQDFQF